MNKNIIKITIFLIILCAIGILISPRFEFGKKQEIAAAAKIKTDNEIFISKALDEFSKSNHKKPSEIAQMITEELNLTAKNPYNKKEKAYTFEMNCKGCNSVDFDDSLSMIILTTYNKKGELVARTVIKPPSYVTYYKDEEKNN